MIKKDEEKMKLLFQKLISHLVALKIAKQVEKNEKYFLFEERQRLYFNSRTPFQFKRIIANFYEAEGYEVEDAVAEGRLMLRKLRVKFGKKYSNIEACVDLFHIPSMDYDYRWSLTLDVT